MKKHLFIMTSFFVVGTLQAMERPTKRPRMERKQEEQQRKNELSARLSFAVAHRLLPYVTHLIDEGADVNSHDPVGHTPLHWVIFSFNAKCSNWHRCESIIKVLLDNGADPLAIDANHKRPRDYTSNACFINLLETYGPRNKRRQRFAFAVASHPRLGAGSLAYRLPPDIFRQIGMFIVPSKDVQSK